MSDSDSDSGATARRTAGELEASVLATLWAGDTPMTPAAVRGALGGGLARTTVATILGRLLAKGAVTRVPAGRAYAYAPVQDAPGLAARRMRSELDKEPDRPTVLARFIAGLSRDDEDLVRALLGESVDGESVGPPGGAAGDRGEGERTDGSTGTGTGVR